MSQANACGTCVNTSMRIAPRLVLAQEARHDVDPAGLQVDRANRVLDERDEHAGVEHEVVVGSAGQDVADATEQPFAVEDVEATSWNA